MKRTFLLGTACLVLAFSAELVSAEAGSPWRDLEPGRYAVGFRLIEGNDPARAIAVAGSQTENPPRPMRTYVWYPAKVPPEAVRLTFGRYAHLADEDVWPEPLLGKTRERTAFANRPLARSLGPERFAELLAQPVLAVENAQPDPGHFPLIVLGQGVYYESPVTHAVLGEYLASHGFVVATCPLVGTHSPLVSLDLLDLETQVRDLEFVIGQVRGLPFVRPDRLGVLGFDMGGMAGVILTMRNPDVDAFASIDAGILFSAESELPAVSPHFDPSRLRVPWLHATQTPFGQRPEGFSGDGLFDAAVQSERYLMLVDGVGHVDFTSYALIEGRGPMMGYWGPPREGARGRYEMLCRYLAEFFEVYLAVRPERRALLSRDPEKNTPTESVSIEYRAAAATRAGYSDFLNALLAGQVERALEIAGRIRGTPSADALLEPEFLNRLGSRLLATWGLADEGLAVLELNVELHPQSPRAWGSLGEGHIARQNKDGAMMAFRKALELDPTNEEIRRILEWVEKRP